MTAAVRETEEEAGLRADQFTVTDFKRTLSYQVRNRPKEVTYWLAELKAAQTPIKLSQEHQDYRWCNVGEACKLSEFQDLQRVFHDADQYLKQSNL